MEFSNGDEKPGRFVAGIDLGTTNSAVAYAEPEKSRSIRFFEIPQLISPGTLGTIPVLPSFL